MNAADMFAFTMILVMWASVGVLVLLGLCMRRNVLRRDPQIDQLLDEVTAEDVETTSETHSKSTWERDADWWKS